MDLNDQQPDPNTPPQGDAPLLAPAVQGPAPQEKGFPVVFDTTVPDIRTKPMSGNGPILGPSFVDSVSAEWRVNNPIGAFINQADSHNYEIDQGFNPIEDVKGTPYEDYSDAFAHVFNRSQSTALKAHIDQTNADRRTIDAGGLSGTIAGLGVGLVDPFNLLPFGEIYKGARLGTNIARSALHVGAMAALSTGASELALRTVEPDRPVSQSVFAIGGGALFGALFGVGGSVFSHLIGGAERRSLANALFRDANTDTPDVQPIHEQAVLDAIEAARGGTTEGVGAAARSEPTLEGQSVAGAAASRVVDASSAVRLNPIVYGLTSPSALERETVEGMVESPVYVKKNLDQYGVDPNTGGKSLLRVGEASQRAVETLVKQFIHGAMGIVEETSKTLYKSYRKSGGTMSRSEFYQEIGRAMRRDDKHAIPQIAQAAELARSQVVNPLRDMAIAEKMLPADVDVKTAASYFSRMYNRRKIEANEFKFKGIVSKYFEGKVKEAIQEHTDRHDKTVTGLKQRIADLLVTPEERLKLLEALPAQIKDLEANNPQHVATAESISPLRARERQLLDAKDTAGAKVIRGQIKDIVAKAGEDYTSFINSRNALRNRLSNARNGLAGTEDHVEKLRERQSIMAYQNLQRLERLHRSLNVLDAAIKRDGPEAHADKLTAALNQFQAINHRSQSALDRLAKAKEKTAADIAEAEARTPGAALTPDELKAVDDYVNDDYGFVNTRLRGLPAKDLATDPTLAEGQKQVAEALIPHLDAALRKAPRTEKQIVVHRGFNEAGRSAPKVTKASQNFTEKGFLSTSPDAKMDLSDFGNSRMHITVPKGSRLLDVSGGRVTMGAPPHEDEILFPRNAKFVTTKVRIGKDGVKTIWAKYLPPEEKFDPAAAVAAAKKQMNDAQDAADKAEFKNILDSENVALRVEELQSIDPEEAVKMLQDRVKGRVQQTADLLARDTERMRQLALKADKRTPDSIKARVKEMEARIKVAGDHLNDRLDGTDASNNHANYVKELTDNIYNSLTGRHDVGGFRDIAPVARGPLKERTFNIPDQLIENYLESDHIRVLSRYARQMSSEVELSRKYGSPDMKERLKAIQDQYQSLREDAQGAFDRATTDTTRPVTPEQKVKMQSALDKRLDHLNKREKTGLKNITSLRDMLRGNYKVEENSSNLSRALAMVNLWNYMRALGGTVVSSLADSARPMMRHGLGVYMNDGMVPLVTNLKGIKLTAKESRLAGSIVEVLQGARMASLAEITDPYNYHSPFERAIENMAKGFNRVSGIGYWTDFQKTMAGAMSQQRIARIADNIMKAAPEDRAYMHMLGITDGEAEEISRQIAKHGQLEQGIRIGNSDQWDATPRAQAAVRAWRAAIVKDIDSTIVTRGLGDAPLWGHTPLGRVVLQFRSFTLASHQKATILGLQERPAGVISGLITSTAIGMLIYYLKTMEGGQQLSDNPARWVDEGLDRSGLFSLMFDVNNTMERATGIGAYSAMARLFPDKSQQGKASRYATRSISSTFLGPTGDFADTLIRTLAAVKGTTHPDGTTTHFTQSDVNAIRRMVPGGTLPVIRSMLDFYAMPKISEAVVSK